MRSSNVQGFVSRLLTVYEEEDDCAPLYGYRRMRSSIFTLHSSVARVHGMKRGVTCRELIIKC